MEEHINFRKTLQKELNSSEENTLSTHKEVLTSQVEDSNPNDWYPIY